MSDPYPKETQLARGARRYMAGLICRFRGHVRPVVAWYCLGESCCSRKCRRCGAPNVAIIDPSGHP